MHRQFNIQTSEARYYWAQTTCICGAVSTCGEWLPSIGKAVAAARERVVEHEAHCRDHHDWLGLAGMYYQPAGVNKTTGWD